MPKMKLKRGVHYPTPGHRMTAGDTVDVEDYQVNEPPYNDPKRWVIAEKKKRRVVEVESILDPYIKHHGGGKYAAYTGHGERINEDWLTKTEALELIEGM
jgi:hypothetical protein